MDAAEQAVGRARARQVNPVAGALAGLGIGLNPFLSAFPVLAVLIRLR